MKTKRRKRMSKKVYRHIYELTIFADTKESLEKRLAGYLDMFVDGIEDEEDIITAFFAIDEPVEATPEELSTLDIEDEEEEEENAT
jgi:hypothetical protein